VPLASAADFVTWQGQGKPHLDDAIDPSAESPIELGSPDDFQQWQGDSTAATEPPADDAQVELATAAEFIPHSPPAEPPPVQAPPDQEIPAAEAVSIAAESPSETPAALSGADESGIALTALEPTAETDSTVPVPATEPSAQQAPAPAAPEPVFKLGLSPSPLFASPPPPASSPASLGPALDPVLVGQSLSAEVPQPAPGGPSAPMAAVASPTEIAPEEIDVIDVEELEPEPVEFELTLDSIVSPAAEQPPAAVAAPPRTAQAVPAPGSTLRPPPGAQPSFGPPTLTAVPDAGGLIPALTPTPAQFQPPAPVVIPGEHRVVVHTLEGQVKRGLMRNPNLDAETLDLEVIPGQPPDRLPTRRLKAVFFLLPPGGRAQPAEGQKLRVTFRDERQVAGFAPSYRPTDHGFFMFPADTRTNTARMYIYRAAVKSIARG